MQGRYKASQRLAERVGFEYEGTLRQDRMSIQGGLRNTRVYSIIGNTKKGQPLG
jgi:RimJ/RimL family protein N-acetyltransferase